MNNIYHYAAKQTLLLFKTAQPRCGNTGTNPARPSTRTVLRGKPLGFPKPRDDGRLPRRMDITGTRRHPLHCGGLQRNHLLPRPGGLSYVSGSIDTIKGLAESNWTYEDGELPWEVIAPANATATILIPIGDKT